MATNSAPILFFTVMTSLLTLIPCQAVQVHGFEIREVFRNSTPHNITAAEIPPQTSFLLEIDLGTCVCQAESIDCEIAIAKSTVLEITCTQNDIYCCTGRKQPVNNVDPSPFSSTKSIAPITPELDDESRSFNYPMIVNAFPDQLHPNIPPPQPDFDYDEEPIQEEDESEGEESGIIIPTKDEEVTLQPPKREPYRLVPILPSLTDLTEATTQKGAAKRCRCKPRADCPEKYLDLRFAFFQCSHNTSRCCEPESEILTDMTENGGHVFSERSNNTSLNVDVMSEEEENNRETCFCLPSFKCSNTGGWRQEVDGLCPVGLVQCCKNGDDGFGVQPIPLPELKIPVTEQVWDEELDETATTPQLPIYYNYQPPINHRDDYNGYYYPQGQGRPQNRWVKDNNDKYSRGQQPNPSMEQSRNLNSDSLFDKIAKIIG